MKIVVVSPNRRHLDEVRSVLEARAHEVVAVEGGKSHLRALAEQEQPDLLLADGMCCDPAELTQVEYVTTHFPSMAVVLMCSAHTPEFLLHSMRAGVREVLPSPAPAEAVLSAVGRLAQKLTGAHRARSPGKVLAFLPCKGGSGATFMAANVASELAHEKSVLLLDLNLQFGDAISFLHDDRTATSVADVAADISRLDASFLAASAVKVAPNLSVLAAPDDPSQALEVKPEHIEAILNVAASHYDFVVLDMGRTLDTLALKALDRAWRIFPVLQASLPGLRHAHKLLEVFRSLGYPQDKIEVIVNRFDRNGDIGLDHVQKTLRGAGRVITFGDSYKEVNASINQGEPLVRAARSNPVARQIIEFAQGLDPKPEEQQRGVLGRLFKRG